MYPFPGGVIHPSHQSTSIHPGFFRCPPARREVFGGPGSGGPDGSPGQSHNKRLGTSIPFVFVTHVLFHDRGGHGENEDIYHFLQCPF